MCLNAKTELHKLSKTVKSSIVETGTFPVGWEATNIHSSEIIDPWKRNYLFIKSNNSDVGCIVIGTLGSDGLSGGASLSEEDIFVSIGCMNTDRVFGAKKNGTSKIPKPNFSELEEVLK